MADSQEALDPIRVLLVEDHTIVREGVKSLLAKYPGIQVVGEAADGDEAVAQVEELKPSVVVMDITMPRMDGVTATRLIKTSHPEIPVIGLSHMTIGHDVNALLRAGASQVLSKDRAFEDLYKAIRRAVDHPV